MSLQNYNADGGDATGLNRVFPLFTEPDFSSHNAKFPTAKHQLKPMQDEIYRLIGLTADPGIPGGRLTLESGVPVSTTDQTAKTTLYYATYLHTFINLWDTTLKTWFCYPFTPNLSLAVGTTTTTRPHDVFAYVATKSITGASNATPISITCVGHGYSTGDFILISGVEGNFAANGYRKITSTGTDTFTIADLDGNSIAGNGTYTTGGTAYKVTLEHLVWTSDTARATALTTQNGAYMKSGDLTRRYLGTFRTTSTTQTEDSKNKRFLWNMYNRVLRYLLGQNGDSGNDTDTIGSLTSTTLASLGSTYEVEVVSGLAEDSLYLTGEIECQNTAAGNGLAGAIAKTSATNAVVMRAISAPVAGYNICIPMTWPEPPFLGYLNYYLSFAVSAGTGTVIIDRGNQFGETASVDPITTFLEGEWNA